MGKLKEKKKPVKPKEFDLIKELKNKMQKEKFTFEGAIVAFRTPQDQTGTITLTEDLGVRLRLIQEAHIQGKIIEKQEENMINSMYFPVKVPQSNKKGASYLG